jgi:hypothetical protein
LRARRSPYRRPHSQPQYRDGHLRQSHPPQHLPGPDLTGIILYFVISREVGSVCYV